MRASSVGSTRGLGELAWEVRADTNLRRSYERRHPLRIERAFLLPAETENTLRVPSINFRTELARSKELGALVLELSMLFEESRITLTGVPERTIGDTAPKAD